MYLPDEIKAALGREAARSHRSEADLIRTAISRLLGMTGRPQPHFGRYSGEPLTVEEMDEAFANGFGER